MSYATFSDFTARYATRLGADEVTSHVLPYAAARLDGLLGAYFAVPFSSDNLTARDLTIDLAYLLLLQRSREPGDARALGEAVQTRLAALAAGREAMVTAGGATLFASVAQGTVWSSTQADSPFFDLSAWPPGACGEGTP